MRLFLLFLLVAIYGSSTHVVVAQDAVIWSAPYPLESPKPSYPDGAAREGSEGWVIYRFMVDVDGKVFAPTVLNSAGREVFQQAALRALQRSRWEPARLEGEPVEATTSVRYNFMMEESEKAVSFAFRRRYDALMEYIEADDQEAATTILDELNEWESFNIMEDALLNMVRFSYHKQYGGSDVELMGYLNSALAYESNDIDRGREFEYLPSNLMEVARNNLFMLQVNTRRYAEALNTYDISRQSGVNVEAFTPVVEQINQARSDGSSYVVSAKLNANGLWSMILFKSGLYVDSPGNRVSEIGLWCRNRHQVFEFQEGAEYTIPESWGQCTVQVTGDPGAEFRLEQYRPE